jgi:spermidine synthase
MRRAWLGGLFFLSGASALVYELVWQRQLNLVFGVSTLSVSATLAAFMGGLAAGGLLFGHRADRTPRPLRLYAALELGVGVTGLLVPPGFAVLTDLHPRLHAALGAGPWGATGLRLGLALLVLAVPATLLGGTVPVMARLAAARRRAAPAAFSGLYAVNALGAVAGAALTGFVLLRFLGMRQTLWLAAAGNVLAALGALWASARAPSPGRERRGAAPGGAALCPVAHAPGSDNADAARPAAWLALTCAAVTGWAATGLEVAWMRVLGILTSNSAHAFAMMLSVLLLGLAAGGALQARWLRRPGNPWPRLAACQWLQAALVLGALPFFRTTPAWLVGLCGRDSAAALFLGELALTAALLFLPAVLMGMGLPLLVAGATRGGPCFGNRVGRLYAANTLGCVAGAFLAGFVLVPRAGIQATFAALAGGTILVGAAAWHVAFPVGRGWRWLAGPAVVLAAVAGWSRLPAGRFLKSPVEGPRHLLYYAEGDSATVAVVEEGDGTRNVLVDGQPVAGTGGTSVVDQKMLAHLPLLLHPAPRRALTVGFGSGGTSYSMGLHGVAVDCVEIEARVPGAADHFRSENHGVRERPGFRLVLDDARGYLRVCPRAYDVIVTDCTNLQYRSNGDLYTVDYFRLMRDRLAEGGLAAAWVPANGIRPDDLRTLLRSFRATFPHTSVWFMNSLPTDFLIVVGSPAELRVDLAEWSRRMRAPGVAEDLEAVGLADPCRLLATHLTGGDALAAYLGDGPLNTDDRPVLSYTTYGSNFRTTAAANLVLLLEHRADGAALASAGAPPVVLLRNQAASNEATLGHLALAAGAERLALAHYFNAARLLPGDRGAARLVAGLWGGPGGGRRP